jgi:ribonucleoside-diphosphate reductase alpha chain
VAIYRDGSKRSQPLNTSKKSDKSEKPETGTQNEVAELKTKLLELDTEIGRLKEMAQHPLRRRLPDTRMAVNHKFEIAGHEGYLTVGLFENGQPGELFITMAKEGSTIGGLMDTIGALTSLSLQYGVPLESLVRKFAHQRFEPSGYTRNPQVRQASSIIDYVFRWMACQFIPGYREATAPGSEAQPELKIPGLEQIERRAVNRPVPDLAVRGESDTGVVAKLATPSVPASGAATLTSTFVNMHDAPSCPKCGHIAVRNGACFKCLNCGESLGCS